METFLQDLRYGLRMLRKSPSFTAIAVLTLALGIGATTAIFSVVNGVLLRPLPYDKPDQIVRLWEADARGHRMDSTDPNFEDLRRQNHSLQGLAEYAPGLVSVSGGSEPTRSTAVMVSRDFFPLMRVQPVIGRGFADEDQHFGAAPTALVSYSYWRQYLNSASDLASSKLAVQDQAVSVIGVLPPGFRFPENADIWMPRELRRQLPSRNAHNWRLLGRLRDGVAPEQAQADLATIARQIRQQYGLIEDLEKWFHQASRTGYANYSPVDGGYFRTLGIPLLRGRWFDDRDTMDAPHVAIITQSLAQEKWPGQDPLGQRLEFGNMDGDLRPLTVVGVVGDVRGDSLEAPPSPTIYVDYRQRPQATYRFSAVIRTDADPEVAISSACKIIRALDPNLPPTFKTMSQVVSSLLQSRRFNLSLVGIFAGTALLLAMAGLYGVTAYAVSKRTGEFGIRLALGASVGSVLRLVLKQGIVTALVGVAIGLTGAFALTRVLGSLLFDLSTSDPATFAAVVLLLVSVALLACYIPARRAAKVDPMVALRYE